MAQERPYDPAVRSPSLAVRIVVRSNSQQTDITANNETKTIPPNHRTDPLLSQLRSSTVPRIHSSASGSKRKNSAEEQRTNRIIGSHQASRTSPTPEIQRAIPIESARLSTSSFPLVLDRNSDEIVVDHSCSKSDSRNMIRRLVTSTSFAKAPSERILLGSDRRGRGFENSASIRLRWARKGRGRVRRIGQAVRCCWWEGRDHQSRNLSARLVRRPLSFSLLGS